MYDDIKWNRFCLFAMSFSTFNVLKSPEALQKEETVNSLVQTFFRSISWDSVSQNTFWETLA